MITAKIPPLRKRIVRTSGNLKASKIGSVTRTLSSESLKPRGKTREWTKKQMGKAIQNVTNGILVLEKQLYNTKFRVRRLVTMLLGEYALVQHLALLSTCVKRKRKS